MAKYISVAENTQAIPAHESDVMTVKYYLKTTCCPTCVDTWFIVVEEDWRLTEEHELDGDLGNSKRDASFPEGTRRRTHWMH